MSAPSLMSDVVEEILLRLPPDDPACLVRASLVCKPWRRLLAGAAFRRRYRELHRRPPLLGLFHRDYYGGPSRFLSTSAFRAAEPDHPNWFLLDCRHGRALFTPNPYMKDLVVWDPMTDKQRWLPKRPSGVHLINYNYTAAVLCAVEGCDHCGCQGGPFRVVFLYAVDDSAMAMFSRLYSSETGAWSDLVSVHHTFRVTAQRAHSVLVGDVLYFNASGYKNIIEYQLRTPCLSLSELPVLSNGKLMVTSENGGLGFASVDDLSLTLWSRQSSTKGEDIWAQCRVIDLKKLLPDGTFSVSQCEHPSLFRTAFVSGVVEGTDIIFVGTGRCVYMVELKSGRARNVLHQRKTVVPYMNFYIPAMEAASADEEDQQGAF